MSLPPEIGVRQNMIYLPPRHTGGISDVIQAPLHGCVAIVAIVLLGICYGGYKLAAWTHEQAVDRWIEFAKEVMATKPIAVVIEGKVSRDDQPVLQTLQEASHRDIDKDRRDGVVRQQLIATPPASATRWTFNQNGGYHLVFFEGDDSLKQANEWLRINGFYDSTFDFFIVSNSACWLLSPPAKCRRFDKLECGVVFPTFQNVVFPERY